MDDTNCHKLNAIILATKLKHAYFQLCVALLIPVFILVANKIDFTTVNPLTITTTMLAISLCLRRFYMEFSALVDSFYVDHVRAVDAPSTIPAWWWHSISDASSSIYQQPHMVDTYKLLPHNDQLAIGSSYDLMNTNVDAVDLFISAKIRDNNDRICNTCLEQLKDVVYVNKGPCFHLLLADCFQKSLETDYRCPLCGRDFDWQLFINSC